MYPSEMRNNITQYAFGNELLWLRTHSKDFKHAVMIGAGPAVMGLALMEGNPELNLLVIDIHTCEYARRHMDEAGFPLVGYIVDDSSEYGKDYAGPRLDFLLVDGDHTKEGVIADVKAWFRHVKQGGLIFFHDFENINGDETNGVAEAIQHLKDIRILYADEVDDPGISVVYRKKAYV